MARCPGGPHPDKVFRVRGSARERARKQAATTGGIVIDTRARFGFTAAPGTTDDPRLRPITHGLPRPTRHGSSTHMPPEPPSNSSRTSWPKDSRRSTSRTAAGARTACWWTSPTSTTSTSTTDRGGAPSARSGIVTEQSSWPWSTSAGHADPRFRLEHRTAGAGHLSVSAPPVTAPAGGYEPRKRSGCAEPRPREGRRRRRPLLCFRSS